MSSPHITPLHQVEASGSSSTLPSSQNPATISPGSPPPYSAEPPEPEPNSPFLVKRSSSTPHLHPPPVPSPVPTIQSQSHNTSRRPSAAALYVHPPPRSRTVQPREETDEDTDACTSGDDAVVYRSPRSTPTGSLRERLFGIVKGRADNGARVRLISTAPGVRGAGETETEGEDAPRNLPTARLTSTFSALTAHSPLSASMTVPLPSLDASQRQRAILDLAPLLFESCRLLSVFPSIFGTLWNLYHALRPLDGNWSCSTDYFVCVLWVRWQCLQLTTGLLKRWRVYYSPLPTLIRLLALQGAATAICWPATHFTLTLLDHEARPLICWAAIGTTTCCSHAIQMWVTSNIVEPPGSSSDSSMKRRSKRKWDGNAVLRECVLPAGIAYFVTAWMVVLSREFGGCPST
ncbi:hypothetical protein BDW22DRAFT_1337269 [Trametopsis cervina]|nr:hypothetical protein BDW22DRAFT_1337269 [Trametopsis cervina]